VSFFSYSDEDIQAPSPDGWVAPSWTMPGWNWTPPSGARPRPDRMPRWLQIAYRTPFVDRIAHVLMWRRGGFDVFPAVPDDA